MPIKVILVDDHDLVREGLKMILESADIEIVGEADNGRKAVKLVNKLQPDIIILDIVIPEMNGLEAAVEIHRENPEVKIVFLSMHSTSEHVFRALDAGASGYLLKKSAGKEVIDAVKTVNAGNCYLSNSVAHTVINDYLNFHQGGTKSQLDLLNDRERQVMQLVVEGKTSAEIAKIIHISPKTVETYRSRLMKKLGVKNVPGLVKFAIAHGLTPEA